MSLRPLLVACLALLAPALAAAPERAPEAGPPDRHVLSIRFEPASGTMSGTDRLTTPWERSLRFQLHDGLSFTATCSGRTLAGPGASTRNNKAASAAARPDEDRAAATWRELRVPRDCADDEGLVTIDFQFEGRIHDPVEQEPSLHFVTGDRTSGLISAEGIFLAGGTYWYPQTGRLETHDFTADLPEGWSVASQGGRVPLAEGDAPAQGRARQRHVAGIPSDGLAMSAGAYHVTRRQHGDIEVATFFFDDDPDRAKLFLDAAETEIDRLAGMVGPYPYPKFDIVENFFTTGYGFPAYTLLGRDVIRMGARALRPGYLDHEIAHVWFGNYVHVDAAGGNWCEGLVSYLTNYLGSARGGEEEALAARRRVSQRYSVDVPPEKDFAPAAFVTKTDDIGASIGYGKVSMVFHLLRRDLGDDAFWKGLRLLVTNAGRRRGSWTDIREAFESASGRDLGAFFEQWIGRAGLPELSLEDVAQAEGPAAPVKLVLAQAGTPRSLAVDVELRMVDGRRAITRVEAGAARELVEIPAPGRVARVTLDPAFDIPRRLRPADLPASLARTLAGDGQPPIVVYPNIPKSAGEEASPMAERPKALKALADMLAEQGAKLVASNDLAEAELRGASILALGALDENVATKRFTPALRQAAGVDLERSGSFRAGDRRWREASQALLASAPHPDRPGATVTVFIPNGPAAVAEARKLFYYGWDQWVAMDGGLAKQRGTTWPEDTATSVRLAEMLPPSTPAARIMADVTLLSDAQLEGRAAGSPGGRAGSAHVGESFVASGLVPLDGRAYFDAFGFDLVDVPQQPVLKRLVAGQADFIPVMTGHAWIKMPADFDATPTGSSLSLGAVRVPVRMPAPRGLIYVGQAPQPVFSGLDLSDSLAVVLRAPVEGGSVTASEEEIARMHGWLEEARRHEAVGLLVVTPGADWPAPQQLAAFATMASPEMTTRRQKGVAEAGPRAAERAAAGDRARAAEGGLDWSLPLIFGGRQLAEALEREGAFVRGRRTWDGQDVDVRFNLIAERVQERNVVGVARGTDPSRPAVLVQAHHDAIGELADGRGCECAVDNASGVAVLLEVARRIGAKPAPGTVVFATTGGEEWGLEGSRRLAAQWRQGDPALRAVINIDSVGQVEKPLHVIGRSAWPELAATVESAARGAGFTMGPDIDKYANRWGSDHWPWSQRGVPAVDLFQADYAVLNSGKDVRSLVDGETLARLADAVEAAVRELAR